MRCSLSHVTVPLRWYSTHRRRSQNIPGTSGFSAPQTAGSSVEEAIAVALHLPGPDELEAAVLAALGPGSAEAIRDDVLGVIERRHELALLGSQQFTHAH